MDSISTGSVQASSAAAQSPGITQQSSIAQSSNASAGSGVKKDSFLSFLDKVFSDQGQDQPSKEELYSASLADQLRGQNQDASKFYEDQLKTLADKLATPDGAVPVLDVAQQALQATVDAGKITKEQATAFSDAAAQSSQVDLGANSLFGSGAAGGTPMSAMEQMIFQLTMELQRLESQIQQMSGKSAGVPAASDSAATADSAAASEAAAPAAAADPSASAMTWKTKGKDGNLAIILPQALHGLKGVSLYDEQGNFVEDGVFARRTSSGRSVFRFSKPGDQYGKNSSVVVTKDSGDIQSYTVPDGSKVTDVPGDQFATAIPGKDSGSTDNGSSSGGSASAGTGSGGSTDSSGSSSSDSSASGSSSSGSSSSSSGSGDSSSGGTSSSSSGGGDSGSSGSSSGGSSDSNASSSSGS